ncbi:hypothetical protein M422DRAFT_247400 [Sphaerobolus stellatus SS14]|nr:hypothetical protein M422DRAFT_247400 [Sphaerobolus stellatus SS14]
MAMALLLLPTTTSKPITRLHQPAPGESRVALQISSYKYPLSHLGTFNETHSVRVTSRNTRIIGRQRRKRRELGNALVMTMDAADVTLSDIECLPVMLQIVADASAV